ncbi:hypothetical protein BDD43_0615 [Mucilaginibacter gracilis]|uniref:Uncharacterized protein n=2 Tax=Mucilaginibacter TaxID=423349 RepID=H1YIL9_9SPHI|nr:hypothetical protein Mucpa_2463 [Mucilaginibacter paludis DSM 18603]RKR80495.1 hypothetical protein BDD43_0615 [Mucilaginibacter gracilis]
MEQYNVETIYLCHDNDNALGFEFKNGLYKYSDIDL